VLELVADDEKEPAELRALNFGEAGEQLVFGVALRLRGTFELPLTGSGECDDVTAAVGWIAFAREVAVGFERVEQRHEDARVDVHERAELALGHRATIVQEAEQVARVVAQALLEDEPTCASSASASCCPATLTSPRPRASYPDGFDAVLDLVHDAPGVPATLVKDGGRVASPTGAAGEGPGRTMVMAAPTPENLERLARVVADGSLRVPIQATYALAQAPDALSALATAHTQGKLAVRIR
jgi:Zinc-binding dehydrogenase